MLLQKEIDVYFFLFVGTATMFLLSGTVIVIFLLYKKRTYHAHTQLLELQTRHQQELLQHTWNEIEEERKRIAKDLHDETGSLFAALAMKLNKIAASSYLQHEERKLLNESIALAGDGVACVRRISHNMVPPELELFGLPAAVEELGNQVNRASPLQVHYMVGEWLREPSPDLAMNIYRVLQELVTNTLRHAEASHIYIEMSCNTGEITISYADNGKGLPETVHQKKGMGLLNMENRISMYQGTIRYLPQDAGFGVKMEIPLS